MKKYLLLTIMLVLTTSVGFSQMMEIEESIKEKEKEIYEAIKNGDMDTFKSHTSEDLLSIYNSGIVDKNQEVENLSQVTIDSYELSDIRFLHPAENVATMIYKAKNSGTYKDEPFSGKYYCTSTWVNKDGEWKAIMHTETEAEKYEKEKDMDR